jgi:hypothetical protein
MGGKPIQYTGKPRGQLVHIAGKGQQQWYIIIFLKPYNII